MNSPRHPLSALLLCGLLLLVMKAPAQADSATWNLDPSSSDWTTAANWTPATVPNSQSDIATFGVSNTTEIATTLSTIEVAKIVFSPGASAYTISNDGPHYLAIYEAVENNSGIQQEIVTGSSTSTTGFYRSSSAGSNMLYEVRLGGTLFFDFFDGFPTADHATFINNGYILFYGGTAAEATIWSTGSSSQLWFMGSATAGNSSLTMDGGEIFIEHTTTGGTAEVHLLNGGRLSIYPHAAPGVTIGSLEGDGVINLGSVNWNFGRTLTVGSNSRSTTFSGTMDDAGKGGGLTKIGTGTLVLTNASTYTAPTLVRGGRLIINNTAGSGTGSGPVQVVSGTLGGNGSVSGPVAIGTGGGRRAVLAPGTHGFGLLTTEGALTFGSNGTYNWNFETETRQADEVMAQGVTIDSAAVFTIYGQGNGVLLQGTIFTVINNTSTNPISGTFSNLPDGGTITVGNNTFQANYEGGDGNDLTLTVVP